MLIRIFYSTGYLVLENLLALAPPLLGADTSCLALWRNPKRKPLLHHALLHKREWETIFHLFFPFPHSSWGSTSSLCRKKTRYEVNPPCQGGRETNKRRAAAADSLSKQMSSHELGGNVFELTCQLASHGLSLQPYFDRWSMGLLIR